MQTKLKSTLDKGVTVPGLTFIIGVCLLAVFFPQPTEQVLNVIKEFIFVNLNWIYVGRLPYLLFF
ncbi:hypothetical protein [Mucilaginibacter sp. CSA2-8R]|uniref:hypothetical protein n=1 Tax=Mucilaginibacter sp. CSA2-8R TaxID=3141542 RepID=UPI00315DAD6C